MLTKEQITEERFHILALSGGGYKGLYTIRLIEQIEAQTGKRFGSHFDLICGTSIGGIIALALATRDISAEKVVEILKQAGPQIFPAIEPPALKPTSPIKSFIDRQIFNLTGFTIERGIQAAKHDNAPLKQVLIEIFDDRTIADLKTRVLIPTANWTKGSPQFFKTPHNPRFTTDGVRSLVDVAMATSAAPVYLPNYQFEHQVYVDGGIVGNAPGIFGVHEAEHAIAEAEHKEIHLLSIGALSSKVTVDQSMPLNKGLAQWKSAIFDFMMACQEQTAAFMLKQKMGDKYHMIDSLTGEHQDKNVALDKADTAATDTILGLANISFQDEIGKPQLRMHMNHQSQDLNFHTQ